METNSLVGIVKSERSVKVFLGEVDDVRTNIERTLTLPWLLPAEVHLLSYACSSRELFDGCSSSLIHRFRPTSFSVSHSGENKSLSLSYRADVNLESLSAELQQYRYFIEEECTMTASDGNYHFPL